MYLDPGFGGMFIQVVVAIVAAGGILIFSLRRKIKALFSKKENAGEFNQPIDTDIQGADDLIDPLSVNNEESEK
jgi:hypothetical protein